MMINWGWIPALSLSDKSHSRLEYFDQYLAMIDKRTIAALDHFCQLSSESKSNGAVYIFEKDNKRST